MNIGLVGFEERIQIEVENMCGKAEVKPDAFERRYLITELFKNAQKTVQKFITQEKLLQGYR